MIQVLYGTSSPQIIHLEPPHPPHSEPEHGLKPFAPLQDTVRAVDVHGDAAAGRVVSARGGRDTRG